MKPTEDEIITALAVIKETCFGYNDCEECPFGTDDGCYFETVSIMPREWKIDAEPKKWRALR